MRIELLLTGNELMTGDILDSNSAMVAKRLLERGLTISRKTTVADDLDLLIKQIQDLSAASDVLLVNGGLGPTLDDLTAQALASAAGVELKQNPTAVEMIETWAAKRNIQSLNEANMKQAILPDGSGLIANRHGSAPGFTLELNQCLVICTPGVPSELKHMLEDDILERLEAMNPNGDKISIKRMMLFGLGESNAQALIDQELGPIPAGLDLGFRAGAPCLELKLQAAQSKSTEFSAFWQQLEQLLSDYNIGPERDLQHNLVKLLADKNLQFTTAESCTGGLIGQQLTQVDGASKVFEAGFITYSNGIKHRILGVDNAVFASAGAVSEACVRQMLSGALSASGADLGVAVSGIAGPTGGSEDKPVGTVYIAWGNLERMQVCRLFFPVARKLFQTMVAAAALDLSRRFVLGIDELPRYIQRYSQQQNSKPKADY